MFVHLAPAPGERGVPLLGPGDLAGKTGHLILSGTPDPGGSAWMAAIGVFVACGGSAEWRQAGRSG